MLIKSFHCGLDPGVQVYYSDHCFLYFDQMLTDQGKQWRPNNFLENIKLHNVSAIIEALEEFFLEQGKGRQFYQWKESKRDVSVD